MAAAISTGATALLYGYNTLKYVSDAFVDEVEMDELPQGRVNNSITEQINTELSEALKRKDITVVGLRPREDSDEVTARGLIGALATVTLSPELFGNGNAKITEWRVARAIGGIQNDNLAPTLKKCGALALTAAVAHLLLGSLCWSWAIALGATTFNSYVTGPWLLDRISDAESLKFANSVATREQLEGGIRYLGEKAKALEERHSERQELLGSYHPYLKEGYTKACELFEQYVPGVKTELEETRRAYERLTGEESKQTHKVTSQQSKASIKEAKVAAA